MPGKRKSTLAADRERIAVAAAKTKPDEGESLARLMREAGFEPDIRLGKAAKRTMPVLPKSKPKQAATVSRRKKPKMTTIPLATGPRKKRKVYGVQTPPAGLGSFKVPTVPAKPRHTKKFPRLGPNATAADLRRSAERALQAHGVPAGKDIEYQKRMLQIIQSPGYKESEILTLVAEAKQTELRKELDVTSEVPQLEVLTPSISEASTMEPETPPDSPRVTLETNPGVIDLEEETPRRPRSFDIATPEVPRLLPARRRSITLSDLKRAHDQVEDESDVPTSREDAIHQLMRPALPLPPLAGRTPTPAHFSAPTPLKLYGALPPSPKGTEEFPLSPMDTPEMKRDWERVRENDPDDGDEIATAEAVNLTEEELKRVIPRLEAHLEMRALGQPPRQPQPPPPTEPYPGVPLGPPAPPARGRGRGRAARGRGRGRAQVIQRHTLEHRNNYMRDIYRSMQPSVLQTTNSRAVTYSNNPVKQTMAMSFGSMYKRNRTIKIQGGLITTHGHNATVQTKRKSRSAVAAISGFLQTEFPFGAKVSSTTYSLVALIPRVLNGLPGTVHITT